MTNQQGMLRTEAVELIASVRKNATTIVTMQPVAAWKAIGQNDERNLNLIGSMGSASAIGLGLALARPNEKVLVLDGDGSLMMQLGTLVSIGTEAPKNLHHVVFNNGRYETSGRQPVPGSLTASFVGLAKASGYKVAVEIGELEGAREKLEQVFASDGPTLTSLLIRGQGEIAKTPSGVAIKTRSFAEQISDMREMFGPTE